MLFVQIFEGKDLQVTRLQWSAITTTLAVCSEKFVTILLEQPILSQMKQNVS